jgi:DNA-binding CsgD family transcriptional regulator
LDGSAPFVAASLSRIYEGAVGGGKPVERNDGLVSPVGLGQDAQLLPLAANPVALMLERLTEPAKLNRFELAAVQRSDPPRLLSTLRAETDLLRPAPPETGSELLTPRERLVVDSLVAGASNKGIAESLTVSENTIKYYVKSILGKLQVQNRAQIVDFARRHGLAQPGQRSSA